MRQLFIIFSLLLTGIIHVFPQYNADPSEYLFDGYQDAIVIYKDGKQFQVPVNYNLLMKRFLFLDALNDNKPMEFGEINKISAIKVDKRIFYISNKMEAIEVLQFSPGIWVYYQGKIKDEGKNAGYGGKSHLPIH